MKAETGFSGLVNCRCGDCTHRASIHHTSPGRSNSYHFLSALIFHLPKNENDELLQTLLEIYKSFANQFHGEIRRQIKIGWQQKPIRA